MWRSQPSSKPGPRRRNRSAASSPSTGRGILGSVSGGCVEGEVIAEAADVMSSAKPEGAAIRRRGQIRLEGWACLRRHHPHLRRAAGRSRARRRGPDAAAAGDIAARREAALVTKLATGARSLVHGPDEFGPDLAPALAEAFTDNRSVAVPGSQGELFINVFAPATRLIVVGAVHVAQALAPMARALGYEVVIVDPRAAFATAERFGDVKFRTTGLPRRSRQSVSTPEPPWWCEP